MSNYSDLTSQEYFSATFITHFDLNPDPGLSTNSFPHTEPCCLHQEQNIYMSSSQASISPQDAANINVRVEWPRALPKRWRVRLQKALRNWSDGTLSELVGERCYVSSVQLHVDEFCAEIEIKPAKAVDTLKSIKKATLTFKDLNQNATVHFLDHETESVSQPQSSVSTLDRENVSMIYSSGFTNSTGANVNTWENPLKMDQPEAEEEDLCLSDDGGASLSDPASTAKVSIKVEWPCKLPLKWKTHLLKALQSWCNLTLSKLVGLHCNICNLQLMADNCAEVEIRPAKALDVLVRMKTATLMFSDLNMNAIVHFWKENTNVPQRPVSSLGGPGQVKVGAERKSKKAAPGSNVEEDECALCLETFTNKETLKCNHSFCRECLSKTVDTLGMTCPLCKRIFWQVEGNQPQGTININITKKSLPGYDDCGTIEIIYFIPAGIQTTKQPNPGKPFIGTRQSAYLPNNEEGQKVLKLLQKAFNQKLIFTIRTSATFGGEDAVVWNNVSHKTSRDGGPLCNGYPDPDYLKKVQEELKALAIQ